MLNNLKKIFLSKEKNKYALKAGSNQIIYDELNECFNQSIIEQSVGKRLLYITSFNIVLHPDDYDKTEQSFPFLVLEVINSFYAVIRQSNYENKTPHSNNWFFQFSPSEKINISGKDGDGLFIGTGHPVIIGRLYSTVNLTTNNVTESTNVKVSFKPKNSDTYRTVDVNAESLKGLDVIAKGMFKIKMNAGFEQLNELPGSLGNVYAEIKYNENGKSKTFFMIDREIIISKKNDADNGKTNVLQIDSGAVEKSHARIRYNDNRVFEIAAFDNMKVNERTVPVSSGNNVTWKELTSKARILISISGSLPVSLEFIGKTTS